MSTTVFSASYSGHPGVDDGTWNTLMTQDSSGRTVTNGEFLAKCEKPTAGTDYYQIGRGFVDFDTSSLPDNCTISAASLFVYCSSVYNAHGTGVYVIKSTKTENQIVSGDWDEIDKTNLGGNKVPSSGDNTFTLNSTGIAHISKTGYTKLALIQGNDFSGSPPNQGNDHFVFRGYNYGTEAQRPTLSVTYTTPPAVTTGSVTNLYELSATLGGNVTDAGGGTVSSRGVCWSTSANPTTANSKATSAGTTGAYTVSATGLSSNTTYNYRAYVITENSTQYGTNLTFTTSSYSTGII